MSPVGLKDADLATWRYDHVADSLAPYPDPSFNFDIEEKDHEGSKFVVIRVYEFDEIPILCNKDETMEGRSVLRKGACYVRSKRKPETREIPTQEDMRALLDLATEKGIRKWITQTQRVGFDISRGKPSSPTDEEHYDRQIDDLR